MADHLDSPGLTSPAMDARVDITDHYAFQKPGHPDKSVLILNVNPLAPTHADEFRHDALYELRVDTNGDALPDIDFRFRFSRKVDGQQFATVRRVELGDGDEHEAEAIIEHAPVSFGARPQITEDDDYRFFAGFRSDPFFFDLAGFLHGFAFTGDDFFKKLNVFSIALEVPNEALGENPKVGIWARTLVPMTMQPDRLAQVDQMGRPAINTVFNHGNDKNVFNVTTPDMMRGIFLNAFVTSLETLSSPAYSAAQATAIADILLPDILTYDYSNSAGYLNGRKLTDDVIDISLNLVTNGHITTDGVGPHTDYLAQFPFVGTPHE